MNFNLYNIIIIISLISNHVISQTKTPEHYSYPFEESYKPLTIRINAIILTRNDGSGNFNLKDDEEKALFLEWLDVANFIYSNFQKPDSFTGCYTGSDFIKDSRLRFSFSIIEVKNTHYWNYLNSGAIPEEKKYNGFSPSENWYMTPLNDSINALNLPKAINVYFTENGKRFDDLIKKKGEGYDLSGNMAAQLPSNVKLKRSSQLHIPNVYANYIRQRFQSPKNYNTTWDETKNWWKGYGLSHELGHSFGLGHSNEYHKTNKCRYTIMSQNHKHNRNWLAPTEIKKIHYNLTQTNLMQFVTEDSHYGVTWSIENDTVWDKPKRFYNDFEIKNNVTLTITETIILPPNSFVKLNKGSKIIFTGTGKIVDAFGKKYENFKLDKSAKIIYQ